MAIKRVILGSDPTTLEYKTQAFVFDGNTFKVFLGDASNNPVEFKGYSHTTVVTGDSPYTVPINAITNVILVDASSGNVTVQLPTASSAENHDIIVKRTDGSANTVSIETDGTEEIDGSSATKTLASQYDTTTLFSNGTAWWIVGELP